MKYFFVLLFFILPFYSFSEEKDWVQIPLPKKKSQKRIKVAYLYNPRFEPDSIKDLEITLQFTQNVVKQWFGIQLSFEPVKSYKIEEFFNKYPVPQKALDFYFDYGFDFKGEEDPEYLIEDLTENLKKNSSSLEEMISYSSPYLIKPVKKKDYRSLASSLVDTLLNRIRFWTQQKGLDQKSIIDQKPYNEYLFWNAVSYTKQPYDLIITNQLLASIESFGLDIHSSLRGGIIAGATYPSRSASRNLFIIWSTFIYKNKYEQILNLRKGKRYSKKEMLEFSGKYLAHEFGHYLLHLGHPFGAKECIMNPPQDLSIHSKIKSLDRVKCARGGHKENEPGASKFYLNKTF